MQKIFCHNKLIILLSAIMMQCFLCIKAQNDSTISPCYYFYSLEDALKQPDNVKSLTLKKHKLKEFPNEILLFKNIERLDLSRNSIKEIPTTVKELKKLHYVNLAQNYLSELPIEMAELPIDTLILWDNQIRAFDDVFKKMPLKYLDMRAIIMTRKEQKQIKNLFPQAKFKKDHPCNCGRGQ